MPRIGVTFNEVRAVADRMIVDGISPTIRNVRELLGTGSDSTIHKHLTALRESCPQLVAAITEMPASIVNAFGAEIARAKSEARADFENRLVLFQSDATELAAACESLEIERDKGIEDLRELTLSRDMLLGNSLGQESEIERLLRENERERHSAEQAQIEVAQLRNKLEIFEEKLLAQSTTIQELTTVNVSESQGKIAAEKDAAVFSAKLAAEQEKSAGLLSEKVALTSQIATERQAAESARMEAIKVTGELTNLTAVVAQKASEIVELSAVCEKEKHVRIANEELIELLQEQLTAEGQAAESARTETVNIIVDFESQITALEQNISESNRLSESFEAEKSGRIAAELKIAIQTSQPEKQGMTEIPSPQTSPSE